MDNILLVFLNKLENVDEFNKIIDKFAEHNYAMYLLDNIKEDEYFSIDSLPELVEFYKSQHDNVNNVTVISNSRDLIFSWYRCYNSVVDDFIYFIDKDEKNYFIPNDRHFVFYYNLSEFSGIGSEKIGGRIYLNINFNNYNKIIDFLIKDNRFRYFDSLNEYDFKKNKKGISNISKKYLFKGYEYRFELIGIKRVETISIYEISKMEFTINNDFVQEILKNIYLIPYITVLFYKAQEQSLTNVLLMMYKILKQANKAWQNYIFEKLYLYISGDNITFKEKIYISSLMVMINNGDERLTEFMMKTLLEDEEYIEYHYEILANILFYHTNEWLVKNTSYELDRRMIVDKLVKFNKVKLQSNHERIIDNKISRIVIVTDQFLAPNHSTTRWTMNFIKSIKNKDLNVQIKVIVEDNLYTKKVGGLVPYLYSSIESKDCTHLHMETLHQYDIDFYYAQNSLSRKDKLTETIKEIEDFKPNIIFFNTPISLAVRNLIEYYPVVYMSYNDFNFTISSDIYLVRNKLAVIKENQYHKLINIDNVYEYNPITSQLNTTSNKYNESKLKYKRGKFNLNNDDFIMVTVGNRLDGELSNEFIDMVIKLIKNNKDIKWIIVGPCELPYLKKTYKEIFINNVIKLDYEHDLFALYGICDIYLNPIRTTGGGSINRAMYMGLPIVISSNHSDSLNYVGYENTCGYGLNDLEREIYKLYIDRDYKEAKGLIMKERFKGFLDKRDEYIEELWCYFDMAISNFKDRIERK